MAQGRIVVSIGHAMHREVADGEKCDWTRTEEDGSVHRWRRFTATTAEALANERMVKYLVSVTAHELAHLEQYVRAWRTKAQGTAGTGRRLQKHGGSEKNTNALASLVERAFEKRRAELMAAWMPKPKAPEPVVEQRAATSGLVVEKRAAKVLKDLERWQRKLKLATTKVKKLKRKAAYYERKRGGK